MPRILIAEDDDVIRKLLRALAERNGCEAVGAADGAEALALLQGSRFDLLVLDLMMPVLNGYELLPHLRLMQSRPAVLVVTAMVGDRYLQLDADLVTAIIPKPFDPENFGSLMAQLAGAMAERHESAASLRPPEEHGRGAGNGAYLFRPK
ncbi:MAG TPA: response regulator [Thermoanaerobaculia bacterium]|jgi:CheY-like chemotaxis protein|nr:response regulator [Thermoanaerobaculia bacterium]